MYIYLSEGTKKLLVQLNFWWYRTSKILNAETAILSTTNKNLFKINWLHLCENFFFLGKTTSTEKKN